MRISPLVAALAALLLTSCHSVSSRPVPQDGTDLWLAGASPVGEIAAGVACRIDASLPREGYHIYDAEGQRHIDAGSEAGLRYGIYALQRAEMLGEAGPGMDVAEQPFYDLRILNHWDNLDDSVERGYAGPSMWEWTSPEIPEELFFPVML